MVDQSCESQIHFVHIVHQTLVQRGLRNMPSLRMLYWYCTITDLGKKTLTPFTKLAQLIWIKKKKKTQALIEQSKQEISPAPTMRSKGVKANAPSKSRQLRTKGKVKKRR